jgi:hypothetical protein
MYRANPDVISAIVGDEAVLLLPSDGTYFGLNAVAARTWQLLGEGRSPSNVIEVLLAEFDVERETLQRDIQALLGRLTELNLVEEAPQS